jgi:hypothetical protein
MSSLAIMEISGKPAVSTSGFVTPSFFGRTKLSLTENRVIEDTTRIIATRRCESILSEIDSVEIAEGGNPIWLFFGFMTLPLYGLGFLFFVLFFFLKCQYIIVRSGSNVQVMAISGGINMDKANVFMDTVLSAANSAKELRR